jgi:hypothetical protein
LPHSGFVQQKERWKENSRRYDLAQEAKELEEREAKEREIAEEREAEERWAEELENLRKTPSSSTGRIHGHSIIRQVKMIAVDNYREQDDAERDFFRQVQACGGNGVINMKLRRQTGSYISIQGDAVVLKPE